MDYHTAKDYLPVLDNRIKLAEDYRKARTKAADAKYGLELMLVSSLSRIREDKPNVGYDMAILMLLEPFFLSEDDMEVAQKFYQDMLKYTAEYKGLERMMGALESKVTFVQSLMRYEREST